MTPKEKLQDILALLALAPLVYALIVLLKIVFPS